MMYQQHMPDLLPNGTGISVMETHKQILLPANPDTDHTYAAPGTYTVKLTINSSDSCTAERIETIVINPAPAANFDVRKSCQGTPVQFNDLTQTGGTGNMNGWNMEFRRRRFGWITTPQPYKILHIPMLPAAPTRYTLTVSTANGCTSTIVKTVDHHRCSFCGFQLR